MVNRSKTYSDPLLAILLNIDLYLVKISLQVSALLRAQPAQGESGREPRDDLAELTRERTVGFV